MRYFLFIMLCLLLWGCSEARGQGIILRRGGGAAPSGMAAAVDTFRVKSTGTITDTDFGGGTPTALFVFGARSETWPGENNNVSVFAGAATSTSERAVSAARDRTAQAAQVASSYGSVSAAVYMINPVNQSTALLADFSSFSANTAALSWTTSSNLFIATAVLFGADDAEAGTFDPNDTQDATVSVTTPGFQADAVILFSHGNLYNGSNPINYGFSVGFFDGTNNVGTGIFGLNGADPMDLASMTLSNRAGVVMSSSSAYSSVQLSTNASGFTATTRDANAAANDRYGYLALDMTTGAHAGTFTTPTSTGTSAVTGTGFTPKVVVLSCTRNTSLDSQSATDSGSWSLSAFDSDDQWTVTAHSDDGAATSDTGDIVDDYALMLTSETGTVLVSANLSSLDSNGFTLNYDAVDGSNAYYCAYLALE